MPDEASVTKRPAQDYGECVVIGMNRGRVLVMGGSTSIGEATALHLRELGFSVLAGVHRDEHADRLREQG